MPAKITRRAELVTVESPAATRRRATVILGEGLVIGIERAWAARDRRGLEAVLRESVAAETDAGRRACLNAALRAIGPGA